MSLFLPNIHQELKSEPFVFFQGREVYQILKELTKIKDAGSPGQTGEDIVAVLDYNQEGYAAFWSEALYWLLAGGKNPLLYVSYTARMLLQMLPPVTAQQYGQVREYLRGQLLGNLAQS